MTGPADPDRTDAELLAEMRRQYKFATLEGHILVDGVVRRRCNICRARPLPDNAMCVLWCDNCIDEFFHPDNRDEIDEFIARKRREDQ